MDKFEYKVRADEIKALIEEGGYEEAAAIADTVDWRRVKSVMMLCTVSDIYKINRRYEESKEILLMAYERHPGGRLIIYSLCELSLKLGEFVQAVEYYKEFAQVAPKDNGRYVLQYKIFEAQDVSLEERISVLEELKRKDYREKWAYELATLYHRIGNVAKCVEECDEIFIWFGKGRYVTKALELKQLHTELIPEQELKLAETQQKSRRYPGPENAGEFIEDYENDEEYTAEEDGIDSDGSDESEEYIDEEARILSGEELEKKISFPEGGEMKSELFMEDEISHTAELTAEQDFLREAMSMGDEVLPDEDAGGKNRKAMPEEAESVREQYIHESDTRESPFAGKYIMPAAVPPPPEEEMDIRIKPVDVSQYNTLNLQQELAESMKELLVDGAELKQQISQKQSGYQAAGQIYPAAPASGSDGEEKPAKSPITDTGIIKTFVKSSGYDDMLSQEYDGQISLVMPEAKAVEKQITGQLKIVDILAEWEKQKKEIEQKRMEEVRSRVRKQTDALFSDFDEATKSGLLEKLEKAMVAAVIKGGDTSKSGPSVVKMTDLKAAPEVTEIPEAMDEEAIIERIIAADMPPVPATEAADVPLSDPEPPKAPAAKRIPKATNAAVRKRAEAPEGRKDGEDKEDSVLAGEAAAAPEITERNPADTGERELSNKEKARFGRFVKHKKNRRQLINILDHISMTANTGNVLISGEEGLGTVSVAKGLVKELQESAQNFSGKVAKISGESLNKKDIPATFAKLENGAVIIEKASRMKKETIKKLLKVLTGEATGFCVFLEDTKPSVDRLLEEHRQLETVFNLRIDLDALDDQSLVTFAKQYAEDLEYTIDDFGVLALHTKIADMQTSDHEVTVAEVQEMVEEAIYYADKKNPKHFFDILVGKRYDEEDMVILRENDFMH